MMSVSIIVPVYNAEKHIRQCIQSLLAQSYKAFEVIAIDDGSTDGSYDVLSNMKKKDERLQVYQNDKNIGVDRTRFRGIEKAAGKYLMFVDADDWLSENALNLFLNRMEEENADVVVGSFIRVLDRFGLLKKTSRNNYSDKNIKESILLPDLMDSYFISYFGVNKLLVNMWGRLYKKEVIERANLKPTGFKMGEDLMFNMRLHPYFQKVAFISEPVYYYRFGGMTSSSNPDFLKNIKSQYLLKKKAIAEYNYDKALPYIRYELINCFYSYFLNKLLFKEVETPMVLMSEIKKELDDSIYKKELQSIESEKGRLLYDQDVEGIKNKLWEDFKKSKSKYQFKKLLSKILN